MLAEYYDRFVIPAHVEHIQPVLQRLQEEGRVVMIDAQLPPSSIRDKLVALVEEAVERCGLRIEAD